MFTTQAGNGSVNVDEKPYDLEHFVDLKMLRVVNAPDIVPKVGTPHCTPVCTEETRCPTMQDLAKSSLDQACVYCKIAHLRQLAEALQ